VARRLLLSIALLWVGCGIVGEGSVYAQSPIRIDLDDVPLEAALATVRVQAGLDLIYADRLVEGRSASCRYRGADGEEALRCVLRETRLRAERVRRRQYVIVDGRSDDRSSTADRVSLSGHVVDARTGERLPGAHVYLTGLKAGTTTNRDGYFVVSSLPPGTYDVRISYLGYQTADTTLTAGGASDHVALMPTALKSEGVLVEAGPSGTEDESQLPGMMSVALDRIDRLPSLSEPDLFRALQWTPGIRKSGVVSGGLSVRGADPDQNLYLLDGAPVYHPWHAFSLISTFQTGTLKTTNLYRGGFPVRYGGRLSAVLDAQMKDGSRKKPYAEAGFGVLSGRFRIEAPITSNTSFMLSGRRSYVDKLIGRTHPVTDEGGRRDTLRTGYYFYDTSAKIAHRLNEKHRFTLSYYRGLDDLDLRLPFDLSLDFDSWLRPADLFFEVEQNWENRVVSARHQYLSTENVYVTSTLYYSGYRAQEGSFVQPTTAASLTSDYRVRLDDAGIKVDLNYDHSVSHEFGGGVKVSTFQFESMLNSELQRSASIVRRQEQQSELGAVQTSGYVKHVWTPSPWWTLESGLRGSYFSGGDYVHVAPRVSARYALDPRWLVLRGSAGLHVQYLHRIRDRQSLAYDLVSSRWIPSSARVRPARGLQFGLGVRSHPRSALTLDWNAYVRETRNLLVPSDVFQEKDGIEGPGIDVGALLGQYTRGQERAVGTELSALYERGPWTARLALGSSRTLIRAPGRVQSGLQWRPSDLDVPFSLRSVLGWNGGTWSAVFASEFRSGYPISAPVARYRVGDPVEEDPVTYLYRPQVNNDRLAPYFRMDLTIGYAFNLLSAEWKATLNLFNVTNRDNELSRTYEPEAKGVNVQSQSGLPILPLVQLEMRL